MSGYYNRNNRGITKKLGPVTAYADAVLAGYKGTREQWAQDMAELGQNVTQVAQNTKLTTELAAQTRVNTEQVAKDTADVRELAEETSVNAEQVASDTAESNRLAEETKQAAAQAKEDAEYAGAAADNFRVDTTLSEAGKAAEAKTTGEKFAQLSEEIDSEADRLSDELYDLAKDGTYKEHIGLTWEQGRRYILADGSIATEITENRCYSDYVDLTEMEIGEKIFVKIPTDLKLNGVVVDDTTTVTKNRVVCDWLSDCTVEITKALQSYRYLFFVACKTSSSNDPVSPNEMKTVVAYTVEKTNLYAGKEDILDDSVINFELSSMTTGYYSYLKTSDSIRENESNNYYKSEYIPVSVGRRVKLENIIVINGTVCIFCDVNKKYVTAVDSTEAYYTEFEVDVPVGACYILFHCGKSQYQKGNVNIKYVTDSEAWTKADESVKELERIYGRNIYFPFKRLKAQKPMLCIVDDDTPRISVVQKFRDACKHNGIVGNYAVITKALLDNDTEGRGDELRDLLLQYEEDGFGMLLHAHEQNYWYESEASGNHDDEKCNQDATWALREMAQMGFTDFKYWIAPGGHYVEIYDIARRHGIKCIAGTGFTTYNKTTDWDRFCIKRCDFSHSDATTYPLGRFGIEQLKETMRDCYENNGWMILTTHFKDWENAGVAWDETLDENGHPVGYARFNEIVQYAIGLGYEVKNFPQAFGEFEPYYRFNEIFGWIENRI